MSLSIKSFLSLAGCFVVSMHAIAAGDLLKEEVVVTGTRTEVALDKSLASVTLFTAEDIAKFQAPDLPTLLQRVAGLSLTATGGRGSVTSLSVRGADSGQSIVLVDGVRTASATSGATALSKIPLAAIDKIEIVKGPLSSLYGADAMGGVIQVFTKRGKDGVGGDISGAIGNYSTNKIGGSFYLGENGLSVFAALNREVQNGFDRTDDTINQDKDKYEELSGSFNLGYRENSWHLNLAYLRSDGEVGFDNTSGPDDDHYSETDFQNLSISASVDLISMLSIQMNAGYFVDDSVNPAYESEIKTQRESVGFQADLTPLDGLVFSLGADYVSDNVSGVTGRHWQTGEFEEYEEDNRENSGVFIQVQQNYQWLSAVGSFRYDDNEAYGDSATGGLALNFSLGEFFRIVPSYGTAFRAPTFNELFWPGYGNPDLLPQESKSGELAFKYRRNGMHANLSFFSTIVENQIIADVGEEARNIDTAEYDGRELDWGWEGELFHIAASISYVDAINLVSDLPLNGRPQVTANVYGYWQMLDSVGVNVLLRGERGRFGSYYDPATFSSVRREIPGFATLDFGLHFDVAEALTLKLQLNNLLDKEYVTSIASHEANYRNYGLNGLMAVEYLF